MPTAGPPRVGLRPGASLVPGEASPSSFGELLYPTVELTVDPAMVVNAEGSFSFTDANPGNVEGPRSLLTAEQGWMAFRLRMGTPSDYSPPGVEYQAVFEWIDDRFVYADYLLLWYSLGQDRFVFERALFSGPPTTLADALSPVQSYPAGTLKTVIATWTPSGIGLSVDGGPFAVTSSPMPTGLKDTFNVGTSVGAFPLNGDVLWFATGRGTLTNADASDLHARLAAGEEEIDLNDAYPASEASGIFLCADEYGLDGSAVGYPQKGLFPYAEYIRNRPKAEHVAASFRFITESEAPTGPEQLLVAAGPSTVSAERFRHLLRRIEVSSDGVDRVRARAVHEAPKPHAFPVRFVDGPEVVPYASGDTTVRFSHRNKKVRF